MNKMTFHLQNLKKRINVIYCTYIHLLTMWAFPEKKKDNWCHVCFRREHFTKIKTASRVQTIAVVKLTIEMKTLLSVCLTKVIELFIENLGIFVCFVFQL